VNFADRLDAAVQTAGNPCLVGIDPHLDLLPEPFAAARDPAVPRAERARILGDFGCQVIDAVAGLAPAVKPQSAFFELLGADGLAAWERVVATAREAGLIVIGDVKRGDIASTASAYATGLLDPAATPAPCDAVTINPFLGADSVEPFLEVCRRVGAGVYVLVRTSNAGSADFQRHGDPELSFVVADAVAKWGAELKGACGLSSVGAVVGATHGTELGAFRERMPDTPFLLPGFGAQGAKARDVVAAFLGGPSSLRGALVNSSRNITFAWRNGRYADLDWKDATIAALEEMRDALRDALEMRR
jgi:orotidine-5'-phosphate decarboxylase